MYEIGTRVKISLTSEYYIDGPQGNNPKEIHGTVAQIRNMDHAYHVEWDNGTHNSYRHIDLEMIEGNYSIY